MLYSCTHMATVGAGSCVRWTEDSMKWSVPLRYRPWGRWREVW